MNTYAPTLARKRQWVTAGTIIFLLAVTSNLILSMITPWVDWNSIGETARVAASIATGHGFSSPFREPTGPSALIPPVYPYLLAGIFRIFGVYTQWSYWAATLFNILVHAISCVLLFQIASDAFDRRTGIVAGSALATFPLLFYPLVLLHILGGVNTGAGLFIPPHAIWNTFLLELAILVLIHLTQRDARWELYGLAWGIATLIDPNVLSLAPAFFAWRLWQGAQWRHLIFVAATAGMCVTPWLVRDYVVFHHFIFIRDGFGLELRVGNQPNNNGLWSANLHPETSSYELNRMVVLGEYNYTRLAGEEAIASIRAHPGEYLHDTLLRFVYFWMGGPATSRHLRALRFVKYAPQFLFTLLAFLGAALAIYRRNRKALLSIAVLIFCPFVHYLTHDLYDFAFQYPIQPEMIALATFFLLRKTMPQTRRRPVGSEGKI